MAEHQRAAEPVIRLEGARFLIVEARYYDDVGEMLMQGARAAFEVAGAGFDVIAVPGALEIPAAIAIAMVPFLLACVMFSFFGLQRRAWQQGGTDK